MNNTFKVVSWLIGALVVLLTIYIFFSQPSEDNVIKIGFIGPLSGDAAVFGEPIKNAIGLAVAEVNEVGGINGRQIEMIYRNGKCNGKDAVSAAQKLIEEDEVKIIIGGVCNSETLAIAQLVNQNNILFLSLSSSSSKIIVADDFIFRNIPSDDLVGKTLAALVYKDHKTAAVISENSGYTQALRSVFIKRFEELGGEIVADESFTSETDNFRGILKKIKAAKPAALLINPQTGIAGGMIIKQSKELDIAAVLYGGNLLSGSEALEIAGDNAEGMFVVDAPGLDPDNPKAVQFLEGSNSDFYLAAAYDDIYILTQAINEVGLDTEKLRDYLDQLKDFNGAVSTAYGFNRNGDLMGVTPVVRKIIGGEVVEVEKN